MVFIDLCVDIYLKVRSNPGVCDKALEIEDKPAKVAVEVAAFVGDLIKNDERIRDPRRQKASLGWEVNIRTSYYDVVFDAQRMTRKE
jgi:hypothetical protein